MKTLHGSALVDIVEVPPLETADIVVDKGAIVIMELELEAVLVESSSVETANVSVSVVTEAVTLVTRELVGML